MIPSRFTELTISYLLAIFVLPAILLMFFSVGEANAQSSSKICRNLNAQLASVSRGSGGNSKKYRQYQSAVRKQQNQLNRASKAAQRNGCVGRLKNRNNRCRQITATIGKMQANLRSLRKTQARYAPSGARNSQKRAKIQRDLRRNGCYGNKKPDTRVAAAKPEKKSRRRTLLEQVFGVRKYNNQGSRGETEIEPDTLISSRYGTFRTLCVRKSDGYYFPISFSTLPERFDEDEQTCMNMCPNHEVALYTHKMPQQDSEDMIGYRSEIPYRAEPFAFAYRRQHNSEIQCRFSVAGVSQSVDADATGEIVETKKRDIIGTPVFRQDPAEIPDAHDNFVAGISWDEAEQYISNATRPETVLADRDLNSQKTIRIVGPAFFPVQ